MTANIDLLDEWLRLRHTWPSDGWDGAGQARADHAARVREVERRLADQHERTGHGPRIDYGVRSQPCVCGQAANGKMADNRLIDRYGNWVANGRTGDAT